MKRRRTVKNHPVGLSLGKNGILQRLPKGYIKFFRNPEDYGLPPLARTRFGYLCVEGMTVPGPERIDEDTGEVIATVLPVLPTHYKCPQTGAALPVEDPTVWIYHEEDNQ